MWYCLVQRKPFHQREREREVRGQIGVRRVLLASDEATPYSGLEAIFPYWPGWRLPEPEPAISFLPGVGGQESFTCGGAVAFLVPACRPTPRFYPLTFTLFGITRIALKWTAPLIGPAQHIQMLD